MASEPQPHAALVSAVQRNCDLADARHAQELSLCTYLLEMRELFRWEQGIALGAAPERARVGHWIAERESHWDAFADEDGFSALPIDQGIAPFDETGANARLRDAALVYGAGLGRFGRPVFFLAERLQETERDGAQVIVAGRELARGMNPPPAMSRGDTVVLRSDAARRWLWTRLEVADRRRGGDDPLAAAIGTRGGAEPPEVVERLLPQVLESMLLHELGEIRAGRLLGADWQRMLAGLDDRRCELLARAVRDLLADCLVTLPALLERDAESAIHFWVASLEGMRRMLAPELLSAYRAWRRGDADALAHAAADGASRWADASRALLEAWRSGGPAAVSRQAQRLIDAAGTLTPPR